MNMLPILNYHGIESHADEYVWTSGEKAYVLSFETFRRQLDWICRNNFESLALARLETWLSGTAQSAHPVMLTFDDGHVSHYDKVALELQKRSMRGLFFISVGLIGQKGQMDWPQLMGLVQEGFEIGSHGMTHIPLPRLSAKQLEYEIAGSKNFLEEKLNVPVQSFSVPRGFYHPRVGQEAKRAGYQYLFTSHYGLNRPEQNPMNLNRIAVRANTSMEIFSEILHGRLGKMLYREKFKELLRENVPVQIYDMLAAMKRNLFVGNPEA